MVAARLNRYSAGVNKREDQMQKNYETARFSSFLAAVLTLLGVAIGLGNVWRFPYMMGTYGGSAFLLTFIILMILVGIPALVCELALARSTRGATITVLRTSFGTTGRVLGYMLVIAAFISGSYYTLVVGNVFFSAWYVALNGFSADNLASFAKELGNPSKQYFVALLILWSCLYVIWRGLKRGIERVSETFVPFFFVVAIYLAYVALSLPGAIEAVGRFMQPDFSEVGIREVSAALGQCFFSIGLGATFALVYGKYISDETRLGRVALISASGDTVASVLATLFIIPTVMVFGLKLNSGPSLLFETVPTLLSQMPSGRWIGTLMLSALSLVAFLSGVAVYQVVVVALEEEPIGQWLGRPRTLLLIGILESALIAYPTWHPEIIGILDLIIGSWFMVSGGLLAVLAITWSVSRVDALRAIFNDSNPGPLYTFMFMWIRYIIPVALIAILTGSIYDTIFS